jgi:hypothetical protein
MLVILIIKGLEYIFKIGVLLNYNSLQLTIISNGYTKVVTNRAKICYLKFAIELLFKGINSGFTANNLDIIYINWYNKTVYRSKRWVFNYKNDIVGLKLLKAKAYKEVINNFILYIRWLLKDIETFKEAVDLFKFTKAIRVFNIYIFNNLTIKKCRFNIYLINFKIVIGS